MGSICSKCGGGGTTDPIFWIKEVASQRDATVSSLFAKL
jgi:hypothetical protein